MAYLTVNEFKTYTTMPSEWVDEIELVTPGWLTLQLEIWSDWINARLRKRYAAPFAAPYPQAVQAWLSRMVTLRCYLKRGVSSTDEQFRLIEEDEEAARTEILEAANSETGLFDLPLRDDSVQTGITYGPTAYSEASPYVWTDEQGAIGRMQDRARRGSSG